MDPTTAATASDPSPLLWAVLPVGAYLVGSFPTAHLLARTRGVDLGTVGSKNYGATNLGRTLGKPWGITCFVIDAAKGALPVIASGMLLGSFGASAGSVSTATAWCWLATAAAGIVGHTLPALLALVIWIELVLIFRMISLASMVAAIAVPCAVLVAAISANGLEGARAAVPFLIASTLIAAFVVFKHRSNIARIRAGTESKVLQTKRSADSAEKTT